MSPTEQHLAAQQQALTAHLRDPQHCPPPPELEARRLRIYRDLLFNNLEGFVANTFPVLRGLYSDADWLALVREFMRSYRASTPYFPAIGAEFLEFLGQREPTPVDPPFLLELAHYEWVELALDTDPTDLTAIHAVPEGDLLEGEPVFSPLAWSLGYRFPVHQIGASYQPDQPPDTPTFLVVYRDRDDQVGFLEINPATARLLELLRQPEGRSGAATLELLAGELGMAPEAVREFGAATLAQLRALDIVLGTAGAPA